MKRIKIIITSISLVFSVGITYANHATFFDLVPCSSLPHSAADMFYESTECKGGPIFCCYIPYTSVVVTRPGF